MIELVLAVGFSGLGILIGLVHFFLMTEAFRANKPVSGFPLLAGAIVALGVFFAGARWPSVVLCAVLVELPAWVAGRRRRPSKPKGSPSEEA